MEIAKKRQAGKSKLFMRDIDFNQFYGTPIHQTSFLQKNKVLYKNLGKIEENILQRKKEGVTQDARFEQILTKLDLTNEFLFEFDIILKEMTKERFSNPLNLQTR